MGTATVSPASTVSGKFSTCANWNSAEDEVIPLTISGQEPLLLSVISASRNFGELAQTSPKLPVSAMTVTARGAPTLTLEVTCTDGKLGSLLATVNVAVLGPGELGVNATWNGKQKSWLIVTGNPADGAM